MKKTLPARRSSDDKSNQNRRNAIKNNPQTEESSSSNFLRPRSASLPTSPRISAPINKISLVDDTGKEFDDGRIIFEIQIVKLALLGGIYGIQLRRLQGELCHYRSLTAQILSSLTL